MSGWRFGLYEFDPQTHELRREGAFIHLQAQPAQVLACLLAHAGEVVTREQLRQVVWGGETFVDFERGLNFCISQVRSALRDEPASPIYIQTVPKQGYRFIAPVLPANGLHSAPAAEKAAATGGNGRLVVVAVCLLGILTAATLWWLRGRARILQQGRPIVAVARFDNETGDPGLTRFSDALTDNLVGELTIRDREFGIVGNAAILRAPREQRDLTQIGSTLHAKYIVLGQVQRSGTRTRILAHLIRLPDQSHLWVVRVEREAVDPMTLEADAAQQIAAQFTEKLGADVRSPLPALQSR